MADLDLEVDAPTDTDGLCQRCGLRPAMPLHTCPCAHEIYGDDETMCNCCDSCREDCLYDI